jgi:hypothetical protein
LTKSSHKRSPTKMNGERSVVARGGANVGAAPESEEEVSESIVGSRGRQAYRAARRAASDAKNRDVAHAVRGEI